MLLIHFKSNFHNQNEHRYIPWILLKNKLSATKISRAVKSQLQRRLQSALNVNLAAFICFKRSDNHRVFQSNMRL